MINALKIGIELLPHAINIGQGIYKLIKGNKKEEEKKNEINEALKERINDLHKQEYALRERNDDYERRIYQLEQSLRNNMQQLQKERIEQERKILELQKEIDNLRNEKSKKIQYKNEKLNQTFSQQRK